jgi:hypothetical protein
MRKLVLFGVVLALGASIGVARAAHSAPSAKVFVCHKTGSAKKPYVRISVSTSAMKPYLSSSDDIVPAPASCPKDLLTATTGGVELTTNMLGVAEQPDLGDPDGTGKASIRLRQGQARVCFTLSAQNIATATGAHIHKGAPSDAGPVAVTLGTPNASVSSTGCVNAPRVVVNDIVANKSSYYVNVHTGDFAGGAVRGQLGPVTGILLYTAVLNGTNARPTPADANGVGTGQFYIDADKGRVCYGLSVKNIVLPSIAAHIHRGDANTAGPVVIPFNAPGANGLASACTTADPVLLKELVGNPGNFYANVHTTQFPGGAVRGQLTPS